MTFVLSTNPIDLIDICGKADNIVCRCDITVASLTAVVVLVGVKSYLASGARRVACVARASFTLDRGVVGTCSQLLVELHGLGDNR